MSKWLLVALLALSGAIAVRAETPGDKDKNDKKASATATKNENGAAAKTEEANKDEASTPDISAAESQLKQLREMLMEQARQLEAQQAKLREQQLKMEELESQLKSVRGGHETLAVSNPQPAAESAGTPAPMARQQYPEEEKEKKSPLSFKIGIADFTPGGFLDFTTIFRTTNLGSGIGTSFGSIPFNNQLPAAALTETRFTAQNSRLSLKVNAKPGSFDVTGYVESDFLGFQPPNANTTSNSNSLRLRLYWAQIRREKWEVIAGQAWTFLTPNRVGLSPVPADIFYSQDMDTNYQVGLTWARQSAFRVIYHPSDNWAFGVSLENPQQLVPNSVICPSLTPAACSSTTGFANQFDNGSSATNTASASNNPATPNLHPDIIVKGAYDGKVGDKAMHVEAAGLLRSFKIVNPIATAASGSTATDTITGWGASLNVNLEIFKNFHLIGTSFYSYGGGRYIFGLGPDVIVRPDGNLSGVHAGSGIGGFEWQVTPHSMFYGYYGGAYFQKNFGILPTPATPANSCNGVAAAVCVGFGFPGPNPSPLNSANRTVQEGTFGVIQTLWRNPTYGSLQIITQASYLTRSPWYIPFNSGLPKNAHTFIAYADVRYTLP